MNARHFKGRVLYAPKPGSRSGEDAELACNIFNGCAHACRYCYVPLYQNRTPGDFHQAKHRPFLLSDLVKDCRQATRAGITGQVMLSFTCDPYQPLEEKRGDTRAAIEILHRWGFGVSILTKAGQRAMRDFDLMTARDAFGVTLTFQDDRRSRQWEPGAALPMDRIAVLQEAHRRGIATFVSIEPVIDPRESLQIIGRTAPFVDRFIVGRWNHSGAADQIAWGDFARDAIDLLRQVDTPFFIKRDLRKHAPPGFRQEAESATALLPEQEPQPRPVQLSLLL